MDSISQKQRSALMRRVGQKNTKPEMVVRKFLHGNGYRFRLHRKDLPGHPDIVLPKHRAAIFVHGCFWHGHSCRRGKRPATNTEFWDKKLLGNLERDKANYKKLSALGWRVVVIWECEIKNLAEHPLLKILEESA